MIRLFQTSQISKIFLLLMFVLISGCAGSGGSSPFGSSQASVEDVYYDYFRDIPIPSGLAVDSTRSLISVTQNGAKVGLLTLEGSVEKTSLMSAMVHNMVKHDWAIVASIMGPKSLQVYKKDGLFAILYYYDQMTSSAMEIWVCAEVDAGAYAPLVPAMPQDMTSRGSTPDADTLDSNESAPSYEELQYDGSAYSPANGNSMDGTELAQ